MYFLKIGSKEGGSATKIKRGEISENSISGPQANLDLFY